MLRQFSQRARSMHDVAWYCAMNYVRSRDAQKQLARTPLKSRKAPLTGWQVGWSKDIRNPYYSFRNPGNFSFTNHIGLVCMHNFCQASTLWDSRIREWNFWLVESGIWEFFSWALESGIQLKESGLLLTIGIRNPFYVDKVPRITWSYMGRRKTFCYWSDVLFFVSLRRGLGSRTNIALQRTGTGWNKIKWSAVSEKNYGLVWVSNSRWLLPLVPAKASNLGC